MSSSLNEQLARANQEYGHARRDSRKAYKEYLEQQDRIKKAHEERERITARLAEEGPDLGMTTDPVLGWLLCETLASRADDPKSSAWVVLEIMAGARVEQTGEVPIYQLKKYLGACYKVQDRDKDKEQS